MSEMTQDTAAALVISARQKAGSGDPLSASALAAEAVRIYRGLDAGNPHDFQSELASALTNLGAFLSSLGRREEALTATTEAVNVRRRLTLANPAAFEPDLASALTNLGAFLSSLGRREEALTATTEAVDIYRRLALANPGAFEPNLATALNKLGMSLSQLGRREDALDITVEVVKIYRGRLVADSSNVQLQRDLSVSLNRLADLAIAAGEVAVASAGFEQALTIRRRLLESDPNHGPGVVSYCPVLR